MPKKIIRYKPIKGYVPRGLPPIKELAKISGLNPGRIIAFYHQMYLSRLNQMSNTEIKQSVMHRTGWVTLHSDLLQKSVTFEYKRFVDFFELKGLLELRRDHLTGGLKYTPGEQSQQYRIPSTLLHENNSVCHFRKEIITDHCTLKSLHKLKLSQKRRREERNPELNSTHRELMKMMTKVKFDLRNAQSFLQKVSEGKIIVRDTKSGEERNYPDMLLQMHMCNDGYAREGKVDAYGERLHTPFSNLWKQLRPFIRIEGSKDAPGVTDIANSQPYFSSIAINPTLIDLILPEFKACIPALQNLKGKSDFEKYAELCATGKLYEYWMSLREGIDRDTAKEEIFYLMFSPNRAPKKWEKLGAVTKRLIREIFNTEFPSVNAAFRKIKALSEKELPFIETIFLNKKGKFEGPSGYHKSLACMMQRMESRIFLGRIVPKLIEIGAGPFLTVHDSVIVSPHHLKAVEEAIRNEFHALGVHPPTLK